MMPCYALPEAVEYCLWPDAVEALVAELRPSPDLRVDEFVQYGLSLIHI